MEKLDYIRSLGAETIYFCPIFEAPENHRYGTADYEKIDPMLGTNEEFSLLCAAARARGMRVLLDGVFNHQGFVSRYFNGDGFYPGLGAHQSKESPYYPWYHFIQWPDRYDAWWGIYSLPSWTISSKTRTASSAGGSGRGRTAGGWTWPTSCPTPSSRSSTGRCGR